MDDIVINTVTGEFQLNKKMIEAMYVPKDDLRKLVEKWEPYELPGEYESLYKDLKELLKRGE